MVERTVTIVNKNGVHARPAAEIVKTAGRFSSDVTIVRDKFGVPHIYGATSRSSATTSR